ncbi:MAG: threonine synthase [Chloroflexi bacterium]|nr:threonine synthase [Chloroflexota bacterium]MDA1218776.1 threonine synthase [Chloroflexota bacterium]PKB57224.1 MAG: threonine synthase [SAR202 cluster bacterium Casp-Chloro-G3]
MPFVSGLKCRECSREYPAEALNVCDFCFGPLEVEYDYDTISEVISADRISKGPLSIWRYQDLLPASGENPVDIMAGYTPLLKAPNLGKRLGLNNLYIKNDSVNPSFSFKDRVVSVAATKAVEFGFETLACASTGNLACSVAAHAARAGIRSVVFIPSDLERGKVIGAAIYGPTMVAVDGTYDEVNRLCSEVGDNYPWAFVNINMRAYYAEGSKTLGYEVAEQLGWRLPEHVVVPSASGAMFTKIWKGFNELACLGLLDGVAAMSFGPDQNTVHHPAVTTRMHMAQAEGCSPIVTAWKEGQTQVKPVRPNSIAKSLAIGNPADGIYALRVINKSGGSGNTVPESDVVDGIKLLAETEGVFTETAGGVVISALKQLAESGAIKPDELTVAYITGNGLKTQEAVEGVVNPLMVKPTLSSFEEALSERTAIRR